MMPATHDTNEPRPQAIWPWLLMPIVVLLVAFMLDRFKDSAQADGVPGAAAQPQTHSATTSDTSGTSD
jgi:hypothetical protein